LDSRLGLPVNTVLDGSYRIERVVGSGGFGITYEAEDINLATKVAIKEYYPFDFGDRDATMSVKPKSDRHRQTFDWGRSNFLQEARTLARFEHPSIVRVTRVFEANSTAYMVMRFEQGHSFEAWLNSLGRLPTQEELDSIVAPMLDALQILHGENFLHRDIAPDNIIVRADGTPVLLDFGAARRAVAEMSRTMTGIVKAGYSPHEQYSSDSRLQGPWSDLYALGGTLYRAVTGHPPEEATLRVDEDHMPPAAQVARRSGYRPGFLSAIDACLKVRHSERPRSVVQLRPMMLGRKSQPRPGLDRLVEAFKTPSKAPQKAAGKAPSRPPQSFRTRRTGPPAQATSRRWPAIAAAVVAVLGGAYGGFEYTRWQPAEQIEAERRVAEAAAAKKKADEAEARRLQEERIAAEKRAGEERARQEAETRRLADAAAARKKADDEAKARAEAEARRRQEERLAAEERARQEAEAKRLADAAAAEKRAAEERARQDAEAKRLADAAAARKKIEEERARLDAEAKKLADAAAAKKTDEERARQEAEAKRLADTAAVKRKADEERARQETEVKKLADAAAAKKKEVEERARQDAEAKKLADAAAAKKKADEERARKEAEAKRVADAAVAKKKEAEDRAEAKRLADAAAAEKKAAEERARQTEAEAKKLADAAAAEKKAAEEAARRQAEANTPKPDEPKADEPVRVAAVTLNAEERATFIKRVQEVLKQSKCYSGAINGSVDETQDGLNRFIANRKGKDAPARIELAKATASDFETWLRDASEIAGGVCVAKEKPAKPEKPARQERAERPTPSPRANTPRYSSPPSGGGGGRVGPIQGIQ
jgi:serine/threonine protein kinase